MFAQKKNKSKYFFKPYHRTERNMHLLMGKRLMFVTAEDVNINSVPGLAVTLTSSVVLAVSGISYFSIVIDR